MVEKDQPLLEVETEKVALDIPAPATGVLREVLVQEGATVPVGTVLARLEHEPVETVMSRVGGIGVRARSSAAEGAPHYSPAVKQVAREHDIQLSEVTGSGEGGRITKKDVLDAVAKRGTSTPPLLPPQRYQTRRRSWSRSITCEKPSRSGWSPVAVRRLTSQRFSKPIAPVSSSSAPVVH